MHVEHSNSQVSIRLCYFSLCYFSLFIQTKVAESASNGLCIVVGSFAYFR